MASEKSPTQQCLQARRMLSVVHKGAFVHKTVCLHTPVATGVSQDRQQLLTV